MNTMVTDPVNVLSSAILAMENQKWNFTPGQDTELDNQDRLVIGAATQRIDDHCGSVEQDLQCRSKQRKCRRMLAVTGSLLGINQAHSNPLQQSLALFFIIVTGKVYALSLMHTINSRQAMRERFKSHDLGRTSLSQFRWSQPLTLVGSSGLPALEVSGPRSAKRARVSILTQPHTKPNATAVSPGLGREVPQLRRTASSVASNYK